MKRHYSDKHNPKFGAFIRAVIGLPYVPLNKLDERMRNLKYLASKHDGKLKIFSSKLCQYLEDSWLHGNYPPSTWNMFEHDGVKTNDHAEGYNYKLNCNNRKKSIQIHIFWLMSSKENFVMVWTTVFLQDVVILTKGDSYRGKSLR